MDVARRPKIQMGGRFPPELVHEAQDYARSHGLHLNVVIGAAVAEYLARRRAGDDDPAPRLHYRRGHATMETIRLAQTLMRRDPRGRKLRTRASCVTSASDGHTPLEHDAQPLAEHTADGAAARVPSEDALALREYAPRSARVRDPGR